MERDYLFLESTIALCNVCGKKIEGKIIQKENSIYLLKDCKEHGEQVEILEEDADYHRRKKEYEKPKGNVDDFLGGFKDIFGKGNSNPFEDLFGKGNSNPFK